MKKRIFAPVVEKNQPNAFSGNDVRNRTLHGINYGIIEPNDGESSVTARMLDIVITPLVAFDSHPITSELEWVAAILTVTFSFLESIEIHFLASQIDRRRVCLPEVEKYRPKPLGYTAFQRTITEES